MKIAIDTSPLQTAHKIRGVGYYVENLKKSLLKHFPENDYIFFNNITEVPSNIDLIHYPYFDPFFRTLPIVNKHKTVVTVHDLTPILFPKHFPSGIRGKLNWEVQKLSLKNSNAIITDSYSSKKDILKLTGVRESKVEVVYLAAGEEFKLLGLGSSIFEEPGSKVKNPRTRIQELRTKYNLPEKFVLYVGDVTWNKNLPSLVEAVKTAKVPLVMVGGSLVQKDYDRLNPWNRDRVVLDQMPEDINILKLGFVPTDDLVALYNLATGSILPSHYEGFGLPVLEAMQSGCPVITTKKGSLEEVAQDAAIYVDPESVESITEGILKVFKDPKLQSDLKNKGIEQAEKFSWEKTATDTIKVYQRVYSS